MWWNCLCILKLNSPSFKQIQIVSPHTWSNYLCILKLNSPYFKQIQTVSPCMWSNCLCILKLNSPYFKQIQTVSPHMRSNCLCTLKLNSYCFKQIQSVWACMWLQVLWVYEETHLLPWISMIFSVALMQNFAFLPWTLIASHSQGFRVSTYL